MGNLEYIRISKKRKFQLIMDKFDHVIKSFDKNDSNYEKFREAIVILFKQVRSYLFKMVFPKFHTLKSIFSYLDLELIDNDLKEKMFSILIENVDDFTREEREVYFNLLLDNLMDPSLFMLIQSALLKLLHNFLKHERYEKLIKVFEKLKSSEYSENCVEVFFALLNSLLEDKYFRKKKLFSSFLIEILKNASDFSSLEFFTSNLPRLVQTVKYSWILNLFSQLIEFFNYNNDSKNILIIILRNINLLRKKDTKEVFMKIINLIKHKGLMNEMINELIINATKLHSIEKVDILYELSWEANYLGLKSQCTSIMRSTSLILLEDFTPTKHEFKFNAFMKIIALVNQCGVLEEKIDIILDKVIKFSDRQKLFIFRGIILELSRMNKFRELFPKFLNFIKSRVRGKSKYLIFLLILKIMHEHDMIEDFKPVLFSFLISLLNNLHKLRVDDRLKIFRKLKKTKHVLANDKIEQRFKEISLKLADIRASQ